jgi:hypothetical protein
MVSDLIVFEAPDHLLVGKASRCFGFAMPLLRSASAPKVVRADELESQFPNSAMLGTYPFPIG